MTASGSATMATTLPALLADGVIEAQIAHGVARITLGRVGADGALEPVSVLAVPLLRLHAVTQSLVQLLGEMEKRMRAQQPPARAEAPAALPGAAEATLTTRAAADAAIRPSAMAAGAA